MAKKEEFKEFVRKNPKLLKPVRTGETTWQKLYEIYDLYGEEETAWKDYLTEEVKEEPVRVAATGLGLAEMIHVFKNIDLDSLQEGIGNVQRVLGVIQDFGKKDQSSETKQNDYKPRPIYKHFED